LKATFTRGRDLNICGFLLAERLCNETSLSTLYKIGKSILKRIKKELARFRLGYFILGFFAFMGFFVVPMFLENVSPLAGAIGGLAIGIYAAIVAVPGRFLDGDN
tara:strand:- start:2369 stop:2683 length:315 start_codon:yes stop_codon:yes gene_type:complete